MVNRCLRVCSCGEEEARVMYDRVVLTREKDFRPLHKSIMEYICIGIREVNVDEGVLKGTTVSNVVYGAQGNRVPTEFK